MIRIRSPWRTDKDLVRAYNEEMELLPDGDWALFHDTDCMLLGYPVPMLEQLIKEGQYDCYCAVTNRIGGSRQQAAVCVHDNIDEYWHMAAAWQANLIVEDFTEPTPHHLSGFAFLLSKKAWQKIGGFKPWYPEGHPKRKTLGIDSRLHQDLCDAGLRTAIVPSWYVYHWYRGGKQTTAHLE